MSKMPKAFIGLIRHSGGSRSPEELTLQYVLDSGFHRNDGFIGYFTYWNVG